MDDARAQESERGERLRLELRPRREGPRERHVLLTSSRYLSSLKVALPKPIRVVRAEERRLPPRSRYLRRVKEACGAERERGGGASE